MFYSVSKVLHYLHLMIDISTNPTLESHDSAMVCFCDEGQGLQYQAHERGRQVQLLAAVMCEEE